MRKSLLALVVVAASGCSLTLKTDDLEPLVDAKGFCSAYWTEAAHFFEACVGTNPVFGEQIFDSQAPECESWARSEDAGRIRYDRAIAEACIDLIRTKLCYLTEADFDLCDRAVRGVVGPGGACGSSFDCNPDTTSYCAFTGAACPGTCAGLAALNESCSTLECQQGLVCDFATTVTCVTAPTETQACISFGCADGLFCNASTVCQRLGRSGAPCTGNFECDESFFCDGTRTPPTCQPFPEVAVQTTAGARCDGPYQCSPDLYCDFSTTVPTCQPRQSNVACATTSAICRLPQICVSPVGGGTATCQNPKLAGQACTGGNFECQPGLTCNAPSSGAAGVCVGPAGIGEMCVTGSELRECSAGWCDRFGTGRCLDYLAPGATCAFSEQCSRSGVFAVCRDDGAGPQCVASCR